MTTDRARLRQLALPFGHVPHLTAADFLEAPSNAAALMWLARTAAWPSGRLALCGEGSVGKTHLLHIWATRTGARLLDGPALDARAMIAPPSGPLAIDDADAAPAHALLHALNAAAEAARPVLLTSRLAPAHWNTALPDLSSRLRAVLAVTIEPPEETLLRSLLARLLAERQLAVPEAVQDWMLARLARTPAALREAAARFDRASLMAGGRAPRSIAALVVADMEEATPAETVVLRDDEDFTETSGASSPQGPRLL